MKPILYAASETAFTTNGLGILRNAIDATVEEALNGIFELEMLYPVTGIHFSEICQRSIILAKPNPVAEPQPFRVYRITKPLNGIVRVFARHLAYDLAGITVSPFSETGAHLALQGLKNNAATDCPFEFLTDKSAQGTMTVSVPTAVWTLLGGARGSVLDTFGGEYEFDRWIVNLLTRRGADRGVTIRYGKNLTSFEQDENCAACYTGVYPYWVSTEGELVQLSEKIVNAEGTFGYVKILPLDFSTEWETAPTEDQLRARAQKYIKDNEIGVPDVSWTVEFVALEQTPEYRGMALLERVLLGDTVTVEFAKMGVSASARAVSVRYKPLLERYEKVTLGKVKSNLADTIVKQQQELNNKPSSGTVSNLVQRAAAEMTKNILGVTGGAVRLLDTNGDGMPDTLYIADNEDPAQAVKVWRFNYEGWGASENGYNGPFVMGATLDQGLLAEFVTTAHLTAGTIQSANGAFFFDLDNGIARMQAIDDLEEEISDMNEAIKGIDGTYFYIRYSQYEDGREMTAAPDENTQYMGTCSTNTETAPADCTAYTWCRVRGQDGTNGTPGATGADGKTQYLHVKYSDDGKTFTAGSMNLLSLDASDWATGSLEQDGTITEKNNVIHQIEMIPTSPGTVYTMGVKSKDPYMLQIDFYGSQDHSTHISMDVAGGDSVRAITVPDDANYFTVQFLYFSFSDSKTSDEVLADLMSGKATPFITTDSVDSLDEFCAPGETLGAWIGTLVDFTETDSLNFDDYTWKKFTEDVDEELNEIRQTITEQYTQIINDSEKVVMNALKSYVQTSDYETFKKTTESELKLLSDKLTLKFSETVEQMEGINDDLQSKINTIVKYFTFDINGLTIGQEDNPNKVVIDNDEISILVNGSVVQRFDSSGRALTPELTVTKTLNLLGYLIDMDEEGNVNCGYVGMEEG